MLSRLAAAGLAALIMLSPASAQQRTDLEVATFAGGCFWCVEADFDKIDGVVSTISGYTGGTTKNPTYKQVGGGGTGHTEAVQISFDPKKVTYKRLVEIFWRTIDPLDASGQFCDKGDMYRTGIFANSPAQKDIADASKQALVTSGRFKEPIVTEVLMASEFTRAEDYHQDFYKKDPGRYYSYRAGCGRDARLKKLWGDEAGGKSLSQ